MVEPYMKKFLTQFRNNDIKLQLAISAVDTLLQFLKDKKLLYDYVVYLRETELPGGISSFPTQFLSDIPEPDEVGPEI